MAQSRIVNIPIAVEFRPRMVHYEPRLSRRYGDMFDEVESPDQPSRVQDPWRMREEFFRLREGDNAALLRFLHRWGWWGHGATFPRDFRNGVAAPAKIWEDRKSFKEALIGKPEAWLNAAGNETLFIGLRPRSDYPPYILSFPGCERAIRATITIDLLNRVKFRICARPDCGAPYAVESDHLRKYCSQYCGHLESLRRKRREAKRQLKGERHAKG